ncbi:MAG TPA: ABC transporter permease [Gammaproteobacteria bacterium]|nr:ABC transporter permease [Gammaproteobacteria bacterium]
MSNTTTTDKQTGQEHEHIAAGAGGDFASFDSGKLSLLHRIHRFFHSNPTAAPAFVLLFAIAVFSSMVGGRFLAPFNLSLILQQVTIIATLGVAQTLIILTAGIDLSVGAIMVLSTVVMGRMGVEYGLSPVIALLAGLLCGAICGAVNGGLVTRLKLPPFIVTLGTWNVFFAVNLWYSNSETIRSQDIDAHAAILHWTGNAFDVFGAQLTYGSLLMVALFVGVWYALKWTAWGRHVYATGDDRSAADLAGIRTTRVLFSVYVMAGLFCAVAGWVLIGRIGSVSPQAGFMSNLDSITAVVIGGTSLFGGRGSIYGTLIGALVVGVFRNGLALAGVDVLWQQFTVGLLIIVAVAIDQWIRRVSE